MRPGDAIRRDTYVHAASCQGIEDVGELVACVFRMEVLDDLVAVRDVDAARGDGDIRPVGEPPLDVGW